MLLWCVDELMWLSVGRTMTWRRAGAVLAVCALMLSCGSPKRAREAATEPSSAPTEVARPPASQRGSGAAGARSAEPAATSVPGASPADAKTPSPAMVTHVAIAEPAALSWLESNGFTLGEMVVGAPARSAKQVSVAGGLADVISTVRADVRRTASQHPLAKATSIYGFRLFDERWLSSDEMSFELIGVFNRIDRRVFHSETCGEVRFVYRLTYDVQQGGSPMRGRLPMTVNVVYFVPGDDCVAVARAWQTAAGLDDVAATKQLLTEGALSLRANWRLKSVETNVQTIRIQSSVHPTMAGHVDYIMRVFSPLANGKRFAPAPMENMPDVSRLQTDAALRAELITYLQRPEVLQDIDRGTLQLPPKFLATVATSVSPRGLSRRANRPFRTLFEPKDFASLNLGETRSIRSPTALLRRLDQASCVGCHQSRAIAGFHHLGLDGTDNPTFDSLYFGSSDHLRGDLQRRRAYVGSLAAGGTPDEFRPSPERQGLGDGHGSSCGLGDIGFAQWTCPEGLVCQHLEDGEVGACLQAGALSSPCEWGTMLSNPRPHKDYVSQLHVRSCAAGQVCDRNVQGFPLGFCSASCDTPAPGGTCGEFLDVDGFQACLRADRPAEHCRRRSAFRTGLHGCDEAHACRSDAVCVRTSQPGQGACVPPYFVFQLRLDGVPIE